MLRGEGINKLVRKEISQKALSDALSPPWVDNLNMPTKVGSLSRDGGPGLWNGKQFFLESTTNLPHNRTVTVAIATPNAHAVRIKTLPESLR